MRIIFVSLSMALLIFSCSSKAQKRTPEEPLTINNVAYEGQIEGLLGSWVGPLIGGSYICLIEKNKSVDSGLKKHFNDVQCDDVFQFSPISKDWPYGTKVSFEADGTFFGHYSAPCGNDCFPSTMGRYKAVDSSHVILHLDALGQHGDCLPIDTVVDINLGIFSVTFQDSILVLMPAKDHEADF